MTSVRDWTESRICMDSESSSSNSTQSNTENVDRRIAAQGEAVVFQLEEGATLSIDDPGAVDLAGKALESFERVLDTSVTFASDAADRGFDLAGEVLEKNTSEAAQSLDKVIKAGVTVAVVGLAAFAIPKVFK